MKNVWLITYTSKNDLFYKGQKQKCLVGLLRKGIISSLLVEMQTCSTSVDFEML